MPLQAFRTGSGSRVLVKTAPSATRKVDVYVVRASPAPGVNCEYTCSSTSTSSSPQVNYHHQHHPIARHRML